MAEPGPPDGLAASVAEAQELWSLWFENSPVGITLTRPPHHAYRFNRAFAQMLGYTVEELLSSDDVTRFTHPDDREIDQRQVASLLAGEKVRAHWDKRYIHADGHVVWARVACFLLRNGDGSARLLVAQVEDRTVNRELEQRLDVAERDSLTGLRNRGTFERAAGEQIARCKRYGEHASLLLLDLDQLKLINDTHGHLIGDEALKAVAGAVSRRRRASDIACRYGGDEFVVLMPRTTVGDAAKAAGAIERAVERTALRTPAGRVQLTASIGIAPIDSGTPDVRTALRDADAAMYAVKRRRNAGGAVADARSG